jgi:hypothetical protein
MIDSGFRPGLVLVSYNLKPDSHLSSSQVAAHLQNVGYTLVKTEDNKFLYLFNSDNIYEIASYENTTVKNPLVNEILKASGFYDKNSFARNGNFTKPIAPLHASKFYIPRRYVKPLGVGFQGISRFPGTNTTHTGNMNSHTGNQMNGFPSNHTHSLNGSIQNEFQPQQNVQEGVYYNERTERHSEGSFEDSQLQHEDPFTTALEFMISERKRLGPDNFPSVKCENEIWKNLHLTLVECEKNFK